MISHSILPVLAVLLLSFMFEGVEPMGLCYGGFGDNLPGPTKVIGLYKEHNVQAIRFYAPNHEAFEALRGSNIDVIVDVGVNVEGLATNTEYAAGWVNGNIVPFAQNVNFRYITVGNELIPSAMAGSILGAMKNIQTAVEAANLQGRIKVSTAVSTGVIGEYSRPSAGAFSQEALSSLRGIASFLSEHDSPLLANIYPYFAYIDNESTMNLNFALLRYTDVYVQDGVFQYRNVLDAMIDTFHTAFEKIGFGGIRIVVSETGWPSAGGREATFPNAQTYLSNLMGHAGKGTPMRLTTPTEIYIFAIFDEDMKQPSGTENNYGIFHPNMVPKYDLHF